MSAAICAYLVFMTVAPIATTPRRSDDKINQIVPHLIAQHESAGHSAIESFFWQIHSMYAPWMHDMGRFFPGSAAWTVTVMTAFQTRLSYKVFLAALSALMILIVVRYAREIVGAQVLPVAVVALSSCITLRYWFDPLDGFSGVVPLTILLTFAVLLILLRGSGWFSLMIGAFLWTCALVTYEVVVTMTPVVCIVLYFKRRSWRPVAAVLLPTLAISGYVEWLRSRVTHMQGDAYQVRLNPHDVVATYLKQTLGVLPLAEQWLHKTAVIHVSGTLVAEMIVIVGLPAFVLLTLSARTFDDPSEVHSRWLVLTGLGAWLCPPVLVAISKGWQENLPTGEAYVSALWGYVGFALLLAAAWHWIVRRTLRHAGPAGTVVVVAVNVVLAALAGFTVAQSFQIAQMTQAGIW
ncbi:MAG: hypothetical protein JO147_15345 [Actinobacteria bacterium]|nr:hypothetical protein [Actinomycetota bacterium]